LRERTHRDWSCIAREEEPFLQRLTEVAKENSDARVKAEYKTQRPAQEDLKRASGYSSPNPKLYQAAQEAVERSLKFAYTGRKQKEAAVSRAVDVRINAACTPTTSATRPSSNGLKLAGNALDRRSWGDRGARRGGLCHSGGHGEGRAGQRKAARKGKQ